jgi:hypothetical protein
MTIESLRLSTGTGFQPVILLPLQHLLFNRITAGMGKGELDRIPDNPVMKGWTAGAGRAHAAR